MNIPKININSKCPICSSENKSNILELNKYPLTELFHNKKEPSNFEITSIDQAFCFCEKCNHGFLRNVISPDFLYQKSNYNHYKLVDILSLALFNYYHLNFNMN